MEFALACERAHVAHVEHFVTARAQPSGLEALRGYIREHEDRFHDLRRGLLAPGKNPRDVFGFFNQHGDGDEILLTVAQFKKACGGPEAARRLKSELIASSYLKLTKAGAQGERFLVKRQLVAESERHYVVALKPALLTTAPKGDCTPA